MQLGGVIYNYKEGGDIIPCPVSNNYTKYNFTFKYFMGWEVAALAIKVFQKVDKMSFFHLIDQTWLYHCHGL